MCAASGSTPLPSSDYAPFGIGAAANLVVVTTAGWRKRMIYIVSYIGSYGNLSCAGPCR